MYNELVAARLYELNEYAEQTRLRTQALAAIAEDRPTAVAPLEAATLVKPARVENPFDVAQAQRIA